MKPFIWFFSALTLFATQTLFGQDAPPVREEAGWVFGDTVFNDQISPDESEIAEWKALLAEPDFEQQVLKDRSARFAAIIWEKAIARYVADSSISVTDTEIDRFNQALRRIQQKTIEKDRAEISRLQQQMENPSLSASERQDIARKKAERQGALDSLIAAASALIDSVRTDSLDSDTSNAMGTDNYARTIILHWKFDKLLYQTYGGDVVRLDDGSLEPVGAHRKFLEEYEKNGSIVIHDEYLRAALWESSMTGARNILPTQQVNFSTPWWEM